MTSLYILFHCALGGIISPILANIYLHEFDKYMEEIVNKYSKGKQKRMNPVYKSLNTKRWRANKNGDKEKAHEILKQMQTLHALDPMDKNFIRIKYVRYADDFLIFVIGSKELAQKIKQKAEEYMKQNLLLELNSEKTFITNLTNNRVQFLGYEIAKSQCNTKITKDTIGRKKRSVNGSIQLLVPNQVIRDKLIPFKKNGKPYPFVARNNFPIMDIISMYNSEIRGLYNYYCLATDVSTKLSTFKYYHYYSMLKTIARKEKSSVAKVYKKYGIEVPRKQGNGTRWIVGIKYQTKAGLKTMIYFNDSLKKVDKPNVNVKDTYGQPFAGGQLLKRINANTCELCSIEGKDMEVHHVRKLKDILHKYRKSGRTMPNWVMVMGIINRKTLVVCHNCHVKIHNGQL